MRSDILRRPSSNLRHGSEEAVARGLFPRLLQSFIGSYWSAALRHIRMLPLEFKNAAIEADWGVQLNRALVRSAPLVGFSTLCCFTLPILFGVLDSVWDWFGPRETPGALAMQYICGVLGLGLCLLTIFAPKIRLLQNRLEWTVFWCLTTQVALVTLWSWTYCVIRIIHRDEIQQNWTMVERAQQSLYAQMIELVSEIIIGSIIGFTCFFTVGRCKYLLGFYIFTFICVTITQLLRARFAVGEQRRMACYTKIFLWLVTHATIMFAKAFNELNARCLKVVLIEARQRVSQMRRVQKSLKKRATSSALEEAITSLYDVLATFHQAKDTQHWNEKLEAAEAEINKILRSLTQGENLLAPKRQATGEAASRGEEQKYLEAFQAARPKESDTSGAVVRHEKVTYQVSQGATGELNLDFSSRSGSVSKSGSKSGDKKEDRRVSLTYTPPSVKLTAQLRDVIGVDMKFDVMKVKTSYILLEVGFVLLEPFMGFLNVTDFNLRTFLHITEYMHCPNPLHNAAWAGQVAHFSVAMAHAMGVWQVLPPLEAFAFTTAVLSLNIVHPGRSPSYFVRTNSLPAIIFSDQSIQQHFSSMYVLRHMTLCPESCLVGNMTAYQFAEFRRMVFDFVLSTDLARHFEILADSRVLRLSPDFDVFATEKHRRQLLTLVIKLAVQCHQVLPWDQHTDAELRNAWEQYLEGDELESLGLDAPRYQKKEHHIEWPKHALSYQKYVLAPLLEELTAWDPSKTTVNELLPLQQSNRERWEALHRERKMILIPEHIRETKLPPAGIGIFNGAKIWRARAIEQVFTDKIKLRYIGHHKNT